MSIWRIGIGMCNTVRVPRGKKVGLQLHLSKERETGTVGCIEGGDEDHIMDVEADNDIPLITEGNEQLMDERSRHPEGANRGFR